MTLQWSAGHDNEAGFVAVKPTNKAGASTAFVEPVRYPVYVRAANGTTKAKGSPRTTITMENVSFADYTTMRETTLGFSSAASDISANITISLPELDQTTYNNWNAVVHHRPGEDSVLSRDGTRWESLTWRIEIVEAT